LDWHFKAATNLTFRASRKSNTKLELALYLRGGEQSECRPSSNDPHCVCVQGRDNEVIFVANQLLNKWLKTKF
jgi:hypothetical protein